MLICEPELLCAQPRAVHLVGGNPTRKGEVASDKDEKLYKATKDQISYAVTYGEFMYQAGSWEYPRRVFF